MTTVATAAKGVKPAKVSPSKFDFVRNLASKPADKASRSTRLTASLPDVSEQIHRWMLAKAELDKHKSMMETCEAQIIPLATGALVDGCRRAGRVESTVRINDVISMTRTTRYCAVPAEKLPELQETFGDDFPRYFRDRLEISLTDDAAGDEQFLSQLVELLGPEEFERRFTIKREIAPTESFHNDLTLKADVEAKAIPYLQEQTIKPYKPSLRV